MILKNVYDSNMRYLGEFLSLVPEQRVSDAGWNTTIITVAFITSRDRIDTREYDEVYIKKEIL